MKIYNAIFYATLNNKQHIKMGYYNNNFRFVFSFRGLIYIFIVFKSPTLNLSLDDFAYLVLASGHSKHGWSVLYTPKIENIIIVMKCQV